jgi:hypothetical protein
VKQIFNIIIFIPAAADEELEEECFCVCMEMLNLLLCLTGEAFIYMLLLWGLPHSQSQFN